jgi:hypothetical protein
MFDCIYELPDALATPGVWLDMPWVRTPRQPAPVVIVPTSQDAPTELPFEDQSDSVVWSQHASWNL